jgi:hypothetical protein
MVTVEWFLRYDTAMRITGTVYAKKHIAKTNIYHEVTTIRHPDSGPNLYTCQKNRLQDGDEREAMHSHGLHKGSSGVRLWGTSPRGARNCTAEGKMEGVR